LQQGCLKRISTFSIGILTALHSETGSYADYIEMKNCIYLTVKQRQKNIEDYWELLSQKNLTCETSNHLLLLSTSGCRDIPVDAFMMKSEFAAICCDELVPVQYSSSLMHLSKTYAVHMSTIAHWLNEKHDNVYQNKIEIKLISTVESTAVLMCFYGAMLALTLSMVINHKLLQQTRMV